MSEHDLQSLLEAMPRIAEVVNKFKSEEVQKLAFQRLLGMLDDHLAPNHENPLTPLETKQGSPKDNDGNESKPKKGRTGPKFLKDLDLHPPKKTSLVDFVTEKNPANNQELFPVLIHYLHETINISPITPDHVFTCFQTLNTKKIPNAKRIPKDLAAAMRVTANRNHYIDTSNAEDIKITVAGKRFVEHDLPLKPKNGK